MSRIAGVISSAEVQERKLLLGNMLSASHSDAGWRSYCETSGHAALGWCGWHVPNIASASGVITAIDGCIYNRAELGEAESDAALVAALYSKHGFADTLRKLNGDFAVAVYDPAINTLWLARDRFGLKPLYDVSTPERFVFASRLRALLKAPDVSHEVNRQFVAIFAASHYRYFDNDPDASPYAGVSQLPAAHMLRVAGGRVTKSAYWSLQELPDFTESEAALAERYRALLLDSVSLRLKSARRPTFTLSGGMDSSSVLACAVHMTGARQYAHSVVYENKLYDESDEIRSMLDATVRRWHPVQIGCPDILSLITQMIDVHDEPVATATWLSHYLLCQEVRGQGFDSMFGGLGGDELNAGEYEHFFYFFADLAAAGREADLRQETEKWIEYHDHPIFRKSFDVMRDGLKRLVDLSTPGKCLPDHGRMGRYYAALNPDYFDLTSFEPVMDHPFSSYLKNRTSQDLFRETIPCCLRAEDRQTTGFRLGNHLPFLDHRLVELMFRVPGTLKFRRGVAKHLLRESMRGILPEETRTRIKKTGWNAPAHIWFANEGHDQLMDIVHSQQFKERGIYNHGQVLRLIQDHDELISSNRLADNHMMFLWQLVNLELWFRSISEAKKPSPSSAARCLG